MNRMLFKDVRDYQILFLALFLVLGVWTRDFTIRGNSMMAVTLACLVTQFVADRLWAGPNASLRSAWITALSLCLLLQANSVSTMILVGVAAILSKFVVRFRRKHFFNPSNLGIILALLFTRDAWVTPGQWGEEAWYAFLFVGAGAMVVRKVGRWETTGAFLGFYALLEAARNAWLGWTWDVFLHRMMSGSLLLFSFFMITDPRVIPDLRRARVLWSALVAALAFILRNYYFIPTAVFWSLFALSPLTILFDLLWPAKRFEWQEVKTPTRTPFHIPEVVT